MIPIKDDNPTKNKPIIRWLILIICSIIFIAQNTSINSQEYIYYFGFKPASLFNPYFDKPTFYPILTILISMFMHGGWLHFLGNMLYLWIFGDNVEDKLGYKRFIIFYLLCGIVATFVQYLADIKTAIPLIGASGAIAGVLGAYIYLFPRAKITVIIPLLFFFFTMRLPSFVVLGFWFVIQFINASISSDDSNIAWLAHIGGFIAGLLYVMLFFKERNNIRGKSKLISKTIIKKSPWEN